MATGKLGAVNLTAAVNTLVYTVPIGKLATINLNICNRNTVNSIINVAVLDSNLASLTNADYIEYNLSLLPNGVIERTGIVLNEGQSIMVYSSITNISATCWGFEDNNV